MDSGSYPHYGGLLQIVCPYTCLCMQCCIKMLNLAMSISRIIWCIQFLVLIGFHAKEFAQSYYRTLGVVTGMTRASWDQLPSTALILPPPPHTHTIKTRREQHVQQKALRCANLVPHCYSCLLLSWLAHSLCDAYSDS